MDNYEKLLERICRTSGLEKNEIERKIEAKKAKLSGLISKEGAAQIVAAELGINFEQEKLKISEIVQGMKRVNLVGKIVRINPIKEFNKNGRQGKVASFLLADDSSNIRTVLWDTNHIELFEKEKFKVGSTVEISNANIRNGELHLSSFADIKESKEKIENPVEEKKFNRKKLKEIQQGDALETRATIVSAFEPRYFEVHPETGKRFTEEDKQKNIKPLKRALLSITLDDGTETIRTVIFGEQLKNLGLSDEEIFSLEKYATAKKRILGEEKYFKGNARANRINNEVELIANEIENVNPDELIRELEAKD